MMKYMAYVVPRSPAIQLGELDAITSTFRESKVPDYFIVKPAASGFINKPQKECKYQPM